MPHKILKSLLPTEEHENSFQRLCNTFIDEKRAHDHRIKMVEKTKHLKDGDPNKWAMCPAPSAHPDIENSIVEDGDDYNIQYELFDDEPKLTLEEKKTQLSIENGQRAHAAQEKVIPHRKRTLFHLKTTQAMEKMMDVPEDKHPKEHKQLMAKRDDIAKRSNAIIFHHAMIEDQIHDLTEKDIDSWKPEPYPEA